MFQGEKTTQAVAYLLNKSGGEMPYLKLMKLLYFADRRVLVDSGVPMTFDHWFAMEHGPVLSNTLNLIRGQRVSSYWERHLQTVAKDIRLISDPGDDLLSEFEEEIMDDIYENFKDLDKWKVRDFSHLLPEWQDPDGSSTLITYDEVLRGNDYTEEEIARIKKEISFARFMASQTAEVTTP